MIIPQLLLDPAALKAYLDAVSSNLGATALIGVLAIAAYVVYRWK